MRTRHVLAVVTTVIAAWAAVGPQPALARGQAFAGAGITPDGAVIAIQQVEGWGAVEICHPERTGCGLGKYGPGGIPLLLGGRFAHEVDRTSTGSHNGVVRRSAAGGRR